MRQGNIIFKGNFFEYFFLDNLTLISTAYGQQRPSTGEGALPPNRPRQTGTLSGRMIMFNW